MQMSPGRSGTKRLTIAAAIVAVLAAVPPSAEAHEFWLEPVLFTPKTGASVPIVHRIGQNFEGDSYPYVRSWFRRFALVDARGERPIKSVEGDDPAAEVRFGASGLAIVVLQSTPDEAVFENMEKFRAYLKEEGLERFEKVHTELGRPLTGIRELYTRCAKALVSVGGRNGSDRAVGLPLELIAERSPYALGADMVLPVRLMHAGKPLEGATVKVFNERDRATHRRFVTDAEGRVLVHLPVRDRYLVSAVHMLPPTAAEQKKADWTSLWASLTFMRP